MAYLINDPNKDKQQTAGMNVVNPVDPNQGGAQPQPQQAGASTGASAPMQPTENPRDAQGGKGGSGNFTNLKSYITANQPQAQKMASTATAQTEKQATAIGQQVNQQKQQLQNQIQQNNAKLTQAQDFANKQLWLAGGMQPDPSQSTEGDRGSRGIEQQNRTKEYEQSTLGDKYSDYMSEYNILHNLKPDGSPKLETKRALSSLEQGAIRKKTEEDLNNLRNKYFGEGKYGQVAQTDLSRFRNLATGQETFNDVQQMNLAKQQVAARRLQQQAATAGTEGGRRDLLKQAFTGAGQQYTRGQQGLDDAIVGGSAEARKSLVDQTKQAAQQAQQGIQGALTDQGKSIQELQQSNQNFAKDIQGRSTGAAQGIVTEADAALEAAKQSRQAQLEELSGVQSGLTDRMGNLKSMLNMDDKANREKLMRDLQFYNPDLKNKSDNVDWQGRPQYNLDLKKSGYVDWQGRPLVDHAYLQNERVRKYIETGDRNFLTGVKHKQDGRNLDAMLRSSVLGGLSGYGQDLSLLGVDPNVYKGSFDAESNNLRKNYHQAAYGTDIADMITGDGGYKYLDATRALDEIGALNKKVSGFNLEDLLSKELGNIQGGVSLDQLRSGADLTRENVIDPNQIAKYSALSQLAGLSGQDLIAERAGNTVTSDKFKSFLDSLKAR